MADLLNASPGSRSSSWVTLKNKSALFQWDLRSCHVGRKLPGEMLTYSRLSHRCYFCRWERGQPRGCQCTSGDLISPWADTRARRAARFHPFGDGPPIHIRPNGTNRNPLIGNLYYNTWPLDNAGIPDHDWIFAALQNKSCNESTWTLDTTLCNMASRESKLHLQSNLQLMKQHILATYYY